MILCCIFTTKSEWMKSEDSTYLKKNTSGNDPPFKQIYLKNMQRTTDLYDLEYMLFILGVFLGFTISNLMNHGRGCYSKDHLFYGLKSWTATFWEKYITWHGSSAVVCMNNRYLLLSTFVFFIPLLFFLLLCFLKPLGAQNATKRVWENIPLKGIVSAASLKWFVWKKNWPLFLS